MSCVSLRRDESYLQRRWIVISGACRYNNCGELRWCETITYFADANFRGGYDEARAQALFFLQNERRAANASEALVTPRCDSCLQATCMCDDRAYRALMG